MKPWLVTLMSSLILVLAACSTTSVPTPVTEDLPADESSQEADVRTGFFHFAGDEHPVPVNYEVIDGFAIYQGDIILGRADEIATEADEGLTTQAVGIKRQSALWTNGVIPYEFDISVALKPAAVIEITEAITHWHVNTPIRFVSYDASKHTKHVRFTIGSDPNACSSGVGMPTSSDERVIKIASGGRCGLSTLIHEIGHTVGLKHEQARLDRDNHVEILWGNIKGVSGNPDRYKHNFCKVGQSWDKDATGENKCRGSNTKYADFGPYDYESIMHYGYNDFAKDGKAIIVPKTITTDFWDAIGKMSKMGESEGLSAGDIAAVNRLYAANASFQGKWSTTYGDMVLSNLNTAGPVFGFYGSKNRKLEFPYITTDVFSKAQSLEGYWFGENPDYRMCATARDGSYYWGRVEFNFDEDSLAFTGKWSYCGITPGNTWNGTRIGAN